MKKILILLLSFVIVMGFIGCSSLEFGSVESNSYGKMKASYTLLSGTKSGSVTVKEGEPVEITVDIVTKSGTLDAYIYKEDEDYDYEGKDIQTSDFTVTLSEPGTYTIRVEADKHKGGYTFSW